MPKYHCYTIPNPKTPIDNNPDRGTRPKPPPCNGCGVCCQGFDDIYVGDKDPYVPKKYLEPRSRPGVIDKNEISHVRMKMKDDPTRPGKKCCIAFDPVKKCCSIYSKRPQVCRDFLRDCDGCQICLQMIHQKVSGDEAQSRVFEMTPKRGVQQAWTEDRQEHKGFRRIRVNSGPWKEWVCRYCLVHGFKLTGLKHEKGCIRLCDPVKCEPVKAEGPVDAHPPVRKQVLCKLQTDSKTQSKRRCVRVLPLRKRETKTA